MAAFAIHRCQLSGIETDVGTTLDVFEQDPHCRLCGLSASEGDMKMQDELATLMTQHLTLNNDANYHNQPSLPSNPPQRDPQPQITYITQHYHHSAHQAAMTPSVEEMRASEQLARHGIDESILFPSQIKLFCQAQPEQRSRLIQLWSIAPQSYGNQLLVRDVVSWPQTSMQQEEEAAQSRYMRMQAESGRNSSEQRQHAEPYMVEGYETLPDVTNGATESGLATRAKEYNRALDPAYQSSREWWVQESHPIEHQYGMLQQMKQLADQDQNMT